MSSRLLIRADASATHGLGHAMRMIALAEAWVADGGTVSLLGETTRLVRERATATGIALEPFEGGDEGARVTRLAVERLRPQWVVADGYRFGAMWQRGLDGAEVKL